MKRSRQLLALLLAAVMVVSTLAACGEKKDDQPAPTEQQAAENVITATAVQFTKSGAYTTTVTSDTVDLSGVKAEQIEVLYIDPKAEFPATPDEDFEIEFSKAEITSAKKSGKGWEISFTDPDAAEYATAGYEVAFTGLEKSAYVSVEFPEITLEQGLEHVTPADKQFKVSLSIEGSEFEDGVTAEDIALGVAFENMEAEVISASAKNLTVELKGELTQNVAGAYQCGTVSVRPAAVKDGYADVTAEVPVTLETAYFDAATLKFADGKITGDFKVYGVADPATLTKDNVKLNGATVEGVEKVDDNTVRLTLSANGVKNVNDFVDLLSYGMLTLDSYQTVLEVSQATFYPIYDYIEQDGDSLKLTLKLYPANGTFADDLRAEQITFSDDFAEAQAESITVEDGIATLILSLPANGMTEETLDVIGSVELPEGAMVNLWGDKTSVGCISTRSYNAESMGRSWLSDAWNKIKDGASKIGNAIKDGASYVWDKVKDGASTVWDKLKDAGGALWDKIKDTGIWDAIQSGAGNIWDALKSGSGYLSELLGLGNASASNQKQMIEYSKAILSELGAVKGDLAYLKGELTEVKTAIGSVLDNQKTIIRQLEEIAKNMKIGQNEGYQQQLETLETYSTRVSMTLELGAMYMALEDAVAEGKLSDLSQFDEMTREELAVAVEPYLPDADTMTDKQLTSYNDRLIDYINKRAKDVEFKSFNDDYRELVKALTNVANMLNRTDSTNPLTRYDEICAATYNFDSQAFPYRLSLRLTALSLMDQGITLVASVEKAMSHPRGTTFLDLTARVEEAIIRINLTPLGHPAEEIKAYPHTEKVPVSQNGKYVSDIAVSGSENQSEAWNALVDEGYIPVNININSSDGYWVFFGYKTTNDQNDAVSCLTPLSRGYYYFDDSEFTAPDSYKQGNVTFYRVNFCGSKSFIESKGNVALGTEYPPYYYYYAKNIRGYAPITDIVHTDFPGEYGIQYDSISNRSIDQEGDSGYYPYSYVLKKKVSLKKTADYGGRAFFRWRTALLNGKSNYEGVNWTDAQLDEFFRRTEGRTLQQEFESAGLKIDNPLAVTYTVGQKYPNWLFTMKMYGLNATAASSSYMASDKVSQEGNPPMNKNFCLLEYYDGD